MMMQGNVINKKSNYNEVEDGLINWINYNKMGWEDEDD